MENTIQLEANVKESFRLVKEDILSLKTKLATMNQNQMNILSVLERLESKEQYLYEKLKDMEKRKQVTINKVITKEQPKRKLYIASKTGKTFHESNCPFGKNIKPKTKITFKRKNSALNAGYKPCKCVKL